MSDDPFTFDPIIAAFFEKEARNAEDYERDLHDPIVALREQLAAALKAKDELHWLASHCRAIGMVKKSDSGTVSHDIALFTIILKEAKEEAERRLEWFNHNCCGNYRDEAMKK